MRPVNAGNADVSSASGPRREEFFALRAQGGRDVRVPGIGC